MSPNSEKNRQIKPIWGCTLLSIVTAFTAGATWFSIPAPLTVTALIAAVFYSRLSGIPLTDESAVVSGLI